MSSTCRFGLIWLPPNTVIVPLLIAWLVRMLTERSRRGRGVYPQMVAGRMTTQVKSSALCFHRTGSHIPFNLFLRGGGTGGGASVTSGGWLSPRTERPGEETENFTPAFF